MPLARGQFSRHIEIWAEKKFQKHPNEIVAQTYASLEKKVN